MLEGSELAVAKGLLLEWPPLFYAMSCHRTHRNEPLDFKSSPYLKQMYADRSDDLGAMKSTQSGVTELMLCREISLAMQGRNIFHVLPTDKLIGRYVKGRFDKTVAYTRKYSNAVRNSDGANNVTMKQVGPGVIAFVGSNSPSSFTEFPADDVETDENDKCDQKNLLMTEDRLAASKYRTKFTVGQPSVAGYGIHRKWMASKRWRWTVKCPRCGKDIVPSFLDHVVVQESDGNWTYLDRRWDPSDGRDPHYVCGCGKSFNPRGEGRWVAEAPGNGPSYYHIGKEFSTRVTTRELCEAFSRGLDDDAAMMRFYNSDLGLPYEPKGSKIDRGVLDSCVRDYVMPFSSDRACVAGVDVGSVLHIRINEIQPDGSERAVFIGSVREVEDLQALCARYRIACGVIDAMPEIRLSRRVSQWRGWLRCEFHSAKSNDRVDRAARKVKANRTEVLDAVRARYVEGRCMLPRNAASIPEFYDHMTSSTRIFDEDRQEYVWLDSGPDHLLLADGYATLARRVLAQG